MAHPDDEEQLAAAVAVPPKSSEAGEVVPEQAVAADYMVALHVDVAEAVV